MKTVKLFIIFSIIIEFSNVSFSQNEIDLLILNKKYGEALSQIENQIKQNATAQLYYKKGLVLSSLQKYQDAVSAFSEALKLHPLNPEILSEMAEGLSVLGNYQDAASYFQKAIKLQPNNLSLLAKQGRNCINLKDYKCAYSCFSDIYAKDSTNVYWNKQLAFCAFRTGNKIQSRYLYQKVLQQNPRDYSTYSNLIRLFDKEKEKNDILAVFDVGFQNYPGDQGLFGERAKFYFDIKNYSSAQSDYQNYFSAGGDSLYQNLMNYGITCYFSGQENNAISLLEICASQVLNDPYVLFYLSLSHKKRNEFEISEQYMNAAIEASTPAYLPEMYHHLGQILGQQRKFKESITALQKANELDPANAEVLFEIATTYEEFNSNKTLALNYYRIYLKEAGESGRNVNYALNRITKIKEDLFFEE